MEVRIIEEFVGKTFIDIKQVDTDQLLFTTSNGEVFKMYHEQDCCESVNIDDIVGDLEDLIGSPILKAEETVNMGDPKRTIYDEGTEDEWVSEDDSSTWTFYKFATIKGYVDIKWYGSSNGYYSESVSIEKL